MFDEDIREIRTICENILNRLNDTSDSGVAGQWNTYQYVANSEDTKAWAAGTPIGNELRTELENQAAKLESFMTGTKEFVNALEEHADGQERINQGNY